MISKRKVIEALLVGATIGFYFLAVTLMFWFLTETKDEAERLALVEPIINCLIFGNIPFGIWITMRLPALFKFHQTQFDATNSNYRYRSVIEEEASFSK